MPPMNVEPSVCLDRDRRIPESIPPDASQQIAPSFDAIRRLDTSAVRAHSTASLSANRVSKNPFQMLSNGIVETSNCPRANLDAAMRTTWPFGTDRQSRFMQSVVRQTSKGPRANREPNWEMTAKGLRQPAFSKIVCSGRKSCTRILSGLIWKYSFMKLRGPDIR